MATQFQYIPRTNLSTHDLLDSYANASKKRAAEREWKALEATAKSMAEIAYAEQGNIEDAMALIEDSGFSDANIEDIAREYLEEKYG